MFSHCLKIERFTTSSFEGEVEKRVVYIRKSWGVATLCFLTCIKIGCFFFVVLCYGIEKCDENSKK
jgi:hypothetical protein